jgi:hypothetical protein
MTKSNENLVFFSNTKNSEEFHTIIYLPCDFYYSDYLSRSTLDSWLYINCLPVSLMICWLQAMRLVSCLEDFLDFSFLKVKNPGLNMRNGVFVCPESWLSPNASYGL